MSTFWVRFVIQFYNFQSILNVKLKNGKVVVSNWITSGNIVKLFIIWFLLPTVNSFTQTEIANGGFKSIFANVAIIISGTLSYSSYTLFCLIQVFKRRKTAGLLNRILSATMKEKTSNRLKINCIRQSLGSYFMITSLLILQYLTHVKVSLYSLFMVAIMNQATYNNFAFGSFAKNFECFIVALMEDFCEDLQDYSFRRHEIFFKRFNEMYELIEEFQICFGLQMTIFVCVFLLHSIFSVSIAIIEANSID